eukprot:scaffold94705_cov32-Tisochrysis_lutea.AAC.2
MPNVSQFGRQAGSADLRLHLVLDCWMDSFLETKAFPEGGCREVLELPVAECNRFACQPHLANLALAEHGTRVRMGDANSLARLVCRPNVHTRALNPIIRQGTVTIASRGRERHCNAIEAGPHSGIETTWRKPNGEVAQSRRPDRFGAIHGKDPVAEIQTGQQRCRHATQREGVAKVGGH